MMTQLLNNLASETGTQIRDLELKWSECRAKVVEKYGREKSGTYEYVRTVLEFSRELGLPFSKMSI